MAMTHHAWPRKRADMAVADRPIELSEDVLEELREWQGAAIEAVRNFAKSVDKTLERQSPSEAEQVVDSALKMADRLVETQYSFLKKVVESAGTSLGASAATK
jgi:ATP-dependent protease HslVU (ClpYQ) peptidase subunit